MAVSRRNVARIERQISSSIVYSQRRHKSKWTKRPRPEPGELGWRYQWKPWWEPPTWRRAWLRRNREAKNPPEEVKLPTFADVYRSFQTKVHPDKLENWPRHKEVNTTNISLLNDFLDIIRLKSKTEGKTTSFPESFVYKFVFYLTPEGDADPQLARLNIRCAGGRCPHLVRNQFQLFFKEIGMPKWEFRWGDGMWPTGDQIDLKLKQEADFQKKLKAEGKKKK